jgi:hypothetical protein
MRDPPKDYPPEMLKEAKDTMAQYSQKDADAKKNMADWRTKLLEWAKSTN